jgi:hypothetical protein
MHFLPKQAYGSGVMAIWSKRVTLSALVQSATPRYPQIGALQLLALAANDAVEADIVFQRVGADDIIIVGVLQPHHDAAGLIDLAADRLEAELDGDIGGRQAFGNRERKTVVGAVRAGLLDDAARRGRGVCNHTPFAIRTAPGARKGESGRR